MNAVEMLVTRRSVRRYTEEKVDRSIIEEVVKTASFAPSWANKQIARYNVIDDSEKEVAFAKAVFGDFKWNVDIASNAAGIIVMSYIKGLSGYGSDGNIASTKGDAWGMYDAGIAGQTLSLALHEKGIGSVILGIFDEKKAGEFINLPENEVVAAIIPYGYPAKPSKVPPRKEVAELLRFL